MLGAALVAKKACELGFEVCKIFPRFFLLVLPASIIYFSKTMETKMKRLIKHIPKRTRDIWPSAQVKPWIKTSLAPVSRVVTKYFEQRCSLSNSPNALLLLNEK